MAEKKFEDAMKRLEEIVQKLESSDLSLKDSLDIFEEGVKLISFCSKKLEEAEQKVAMLVKESDGKYTQQPFEMGQKDES
ncbi:MAG: exodeoxyribonuclease VII small subunit [Deltaproteobacteria bacterium]|jgi:exodeoxyribonuclease VII small subunit|nr:MAG: exodeoxyribonuclease VII small subunit [Deltaproteobacteria bacterium]